MSSCGALTLIFLHQITASLVQSQRLCLQRDSASCFLFRFSHHIGVLAALEGFPATKRDLHLGLPPALSRSDSTLLYSTVAVFRMNTAAGRWGIMGVFIIWRWNMPTRMLHSLICDPPVCLKNVHFNGDGGYYKPHSSSSTLAAARQYPCAYKIKVRATYNKWFSERDIAFEDMLFHF